MSLKLRQGQLWKNDAGFIRIVNLERLQVGYKMFTDLSAKEGAHHQGTKKEFCRLLKGYTLFDSAAAPAADDSKGSAP